MNADIANAQSSHTSTAGAGSYSIAMASVQQGTSLFALVWLTTTQTGFTSISDTQGNTWVQVGTWVTNGFTCGVFWVQSALSTSDTSVTVTVNAAQGNCGIECLNYRGSFTAVRANTSNSGTGTAFSVGPVTAGANDLMLALGQVGNFSVTLAPGGSYTNRVNGGNATAAQDILIASAGAQSATGTWSASNTWVGFLLAVTPSTAAAPNWQRRQYNHNVSASSASFPVAYNVPNNSGNLLVAVLDFFNASNVLTSITDTQGNTWVPAVAPVNPGAQNRWSAVYYVQSAKPGTNTVTLAFSVAVDVWLAIGEYIGQRANALDATANFGAPANTTNWQFTISPTQANELIVCGGGQNSGGNTNWTDAAGMTNIWDTGINDIYQDAINTVASGATTVGGTWAAVKTGSLAAASFFGPVTSAGFAQSFRDFVNKRGDDDTPPFYW